MKPIKSVVKQTVIKCEPLGSKKEMMDGWTDVQPVRNKWAVKTMQCSMTLNTQGRRKDGWTDKLMYIWYGTNGQ